jgi:hypothetical protein
LLGRVNEKKRGERESEREHTEDTESEKQEINREVIVNPRTDHKGIELGRWPAVYLIQAMIGARLLPACC